MSKVEVACLLVALIVVVSRFAGGRVARPPVYTARVLNSKIVRSSDIAIDRAVSNRLEKKTNTTRSL
jgi:hypothetical protein